MDWLRDQPLMLMFFIVALGCLAERIPFVRNTLGSASVLFVGLVVGAIDSELFLPRELYEFGLVLFVYTIGLSCGPNFFRTLRSNLPGNLLIATAIVVFAVAVFAVAWTMNLNARTAAGFFAGSLTNTPALASLAERLAEQGVSGRELSEPIVGYSIAYPISLLTVLLVVKLVNKRLAVDFQSEAKNLVDLKASGEEILNVAVRVERSDLSHIPIEVLRRGHGWHALFGRRIRHKSESLVAQGDCFEHGDLVSVIGTNEAILQVESFLGQRVPESTLDADRLHYDNRRVFLSNSQLFGRRIDELKLMETFSAIVTRVRRGDNDFTASPEMVLEPGDRLRVLSPRSNMKALSKYLGDSYRALSEIDFLSLSLGLLLGFCVGQIPLPAPNGLDLKLGIAGGPLIVAIVLGWAGRTGPMVWSIPFSANLTLRQLGMVMFLAGVGTRAGNNFVESLLSGGWWLIIVTAILVAIAVLATLFVGYRLMKIPMSVMMGIVAGMQTQPALLTYATQQTQNDSPGVGYASVYPTAMILKILAAQTILVLLS